MVLLLYPFLMNYHKLSFVSIIIAASLFALLNLGNHAFLDYDEAIYANVLHDSIKNNNLLSLTKDEQPWFDKPPLYFLLMAASVQLFGETEFALRLPGALFTILAITLTWLIAYEISRDHTLASLAAFILLTTTIFIFGGRQIRFDVPAAAMMLFAFYSFLKGLSSSSWWYLGMGAGTAGAFFFRSVLGLLIFPYIVIYTFFTRQWRWIKNRFFWLGILIIFSVLALWFIYQTHTIGARFWTEHMLGHILGRYVNPIIGTQEAFYYTEKLFGIVEPWTVIFIITALLSFLFKRDVTTYKDIRYAFFFITFFSLFLFGLSTSKLFYYIFPMIPFAALFIAFAGYPFLKRLWAIAPALTTLCVAVFAISTLSLTIIQIFFPLNEDVLLLPLGSRAQRFAEEEKIIGSLIKTRNLPTYIYDELPQRDTINYYSGGVPLIPANSDTMFQLPHALILPATAFVKNTDAQTLYQGEFLSLYRVGKK